VGSLGIVAIGGVVRACTLQGRELCLGRCVVGPVTALAGVCLHDVARGAHEGGTRLLSSHVRPVSSTATHSPTYLPLHTAQIFRCRARRQSIAPVRATTPLTMPRPPVLAPRGGPGHFSKPEPLWRRVRRGSVSARTLVYCESCARRCGRPGLVLWQRKRPQAGLFSSQCLDVSPPEHLFRCPSCHLELTRPYSNGTLYLDCSAAFFCAIGSTPLRPSVGVCISTSGFPQVLGVTSFIHGTRVLQVYVI